MARFLVTACSVQFRAWVNDEGQVRTVRLAGRLSREHAAELLRVCAEPPGALRIGLADLMSADEAGLEVLVRLRSRGAELVGVSPYLALKLETAQAAPTAPERAAGSAGDGTQAGPTGPAR